MFLVRHLILPLLLLGAGAAAAEPKPASPSANKGKSGTYQSQTRQAGCAYYVCVPKTYGDDAPAGIHLYFHENGGHNTAMVFDTWNREFLTPFNLIGINMEYTDDDNRVNTAGKSAAAHEAVAQVIADYKIIVGRGVIASYAAGGLTQAQFAQEAGRVRGAAWPFCHSALYTSIYPASPSGMAPMSWFIGVGSVAWMFQNDRIGADAVARTTELMQGAQKGGCPDICLKITKGQDNLVSKSDVAASAKGFARSDLAYAPFIYAPDFADKELRAIVDSANELQLGSAQAALSKLAAKTGLADAVKAKADQLTAKIGERVGRIVEECKDLADSDPTLFAFYAPLFAAQCKGLPAEKELKDLIAGTKKDKGFAAHLAASAELARTLPGLIMVDDKYPKVTAQKAALLQAAETRLKPDSLAGTMAKELVLLKE